MIEGSNLAAAYHQEKIADKKVNKKQIGVLKGHGGKYRVKSVIDKQMKNIRKSISWINILKDRLESELFLEFSAAEAQW